VFASSKGFRREFITAVVLVVMSIIALILIQYQVGTVRAGRPGYLIVVTPRSFPMFASGLMLVISTLNLLLVMKNRKAKPNSEEPYEKMDLKSSLPVFIVLLSYGFVLEPLGYVLSTILLTIFMLYHFRARKWQVALLGVFLPPIVYYVFKLLYVPLPKGFIGL
jgi:putative tricarboxylic transport membrane protein